MMVGAQINGKYQSRDKSVFNQDMVQCLLIINGIILFHSNGSKDEPVITVLIGGKRKARGYLVHTERFNKDFAKDTHDADSDERWRCGSK